MNADTQIIKNTRILIVDDDPMNASVLEQIVKRAGYAICITLTDPVQAVERFQQLGPDIVLLDLHMTPISGIQVLTRLGALMKDNLPPILVLTGDTTPEAKHEALAAGATDFISKPLDSAEVLLRIRNHLQARLLHQQCQNHNVTLEALVEERTNDLQMRTQELEETIVQLREAQQQAMRHERLRALGTMASGIAHDLNNALSLILGYADLIVSDAKHSDAELTPHVRPIITAAQDCSQMVSRLREFYRPRTVQEERQPLQINEIIKEVVTMTEPRWKSEAEARGIDIRVRTKLGRVDDISGAASELREVLTNLIFNAIDAMPDGGEITIAASQEGSCARIEVSDTGVGMSEETRQRCLEPFYTTKGERGSGLGLSVSYGIIRRHDGSIRIESAPGRGTTFILRLPVLDEEAAVVTREESEATHPLRVLVVDDYPAIREIVGAYLAEDRHVVETAASGSEALEKFAEGRFDLVITDRAMPDMNGEELAAAIKDISPREPVILLTGFADLIHDTGEYSKDVDLVVSKPARLDDLRRAITTVMMNAA